MSEYKVVIGAELNTGDFNTIKAQLNNLEQQKKINLNINKKGIDSQLNSIRKQIQNLSNIKVNIGGKATKELNAALKSVDLNNLGTKMSSSGISKITQEIKEADIVTKRFGSNAKRMQDAFEKIGLNSNIAKEFTKELDKVKAKVTNVTSKINEDGSIVLTVRGIDEAERAVTVIGKLKASDSIDDIKINLKVSEDLTKAEKSINKIKNKLKFNDTGFSGFDKEINKTLSDFKKLSTQSTELRKDIDSLGISYREIEAAMAFGDMNKAIAANERYEETLKKINQQLEIQKRSQQDTNIDTKLGYDRDKFSEKIQEWLTDNSAAAIETKNKMRELAAAVKDCDRETLGRLTREFESLDSATKVAGRNMKNFGGRLKDQMKQYSTYLSASSLFMYGELAIEDMFRQVVAIDSAMTELKKVTNETDSTYNQFLSNAAERASELGTTIDGLVTSTADFARFGYDMAEAAKLAEVANIYAVVGDEIESVEVATENLVSTMAAYGDEVEAMSIIDKFNEVSNNFAISSGGLGEAFRRSAASMQLAGNSIDESIALITASNSVIQDPTVVGKSVADIKNGYNG